MDALNNTLPLPYRPGSQARLLQGADPSLRHSATLSHLESQLSCALVLKSGPEYHLWMLTYVRYLVQEGKGCWCLLIVL